MQAVYEFRVRHDGTSSAYYYPPHGDVVAMEEWFDRPAEEFIAGMQGRGFQLRVESFDIAGHQWTEYVWSK